MNSDTMTLLGNSILAAVTAVPIMLFVTLSASSDTSTMLWGIGCALVSVTGACVAGARGARLDAGGDRR